MRALLLVAAGACFSLAALLRPSVPAAGVSPLSSLARSLGGARVLLVDALFLRAEALRGEGRVHELPALYRTLLELDPDNVAALDHLVSAYAFDFLGEAPDAPARLGWWREAWSLLAAGLERHPRDPRLLLRASDLLSHVLFHHPDLRAPLEAERGDVDLEAVTYAEAAAVEASDVPGRGRTHLRRIAELAPGVALARLPDGPAVERLLDVAAAVLERRRATYSTMRELLPASPAAPEGSLPLDRVLEWRIRTTRDLRAALRAGDRALGRALVQAYEAAVSGDPFAELFEEALR